jgi:hypothetical protein
MNRPPADAPALADHVQALYPLARVLAGADEAPALIRNTYEEAAAVPPDARPDDERGWLVELMVEARGAALHAAGAEVSPRSDTSFTNDPFRREVAGQLADTHLPVAYAACSLHERFLLAVDALANPSDEGLAEALDTTPTNARSIRDQARSTLRASLRDVLTGPERMLVDVALPDEALQAHLRTLLTDRFHPVPASLRSDVTDIVEAAQAERATAAADAETDDAGRWPRPTSRTGLVVLLVVLLLAGGGAGAVAYFSGGPTPPSASVVEQALRRAPGLQATHPFTAPDQAAAYVQRVWNRTLTVPTIEAAELSGVARAEIGSETVPVLLYRNAENGAEIAAFAFNYALLDRLGDRAALSQPLRARLAAPDSLVARRRPDRSVVLWRQRDDIFVVVAPGVAPDALRARIRPSP